MPRRSRTTLSGRTGAIGLFGGTFNPPHSGHILIARTAMRRLFLDRVIFIPSAAPPHKDPRALASARDRLRMVRLAISPYSRFEVSPTELHRSGTSFTYHTVVAMRRRFPNRPLVFIIGADTIQELPTWHRYRELLRLVRFVAVSRPGYTPIQPAETGGHLTMLRARGLRTSSTAIRKAITRGRRSPGLPATIAAFIRRHGLYREN